jgi:hypothetical protein
MFIQVSVQCQFKNAFIVYPHVELAIYSNKTQSIVYKVHEE